MTAPTVTLPMDSQLKWGGGEAECKKSQHAIFFSFLFDPVPAWKLRLGFMLEATGTAGKKLLAGDFDSRWEAGGVWLSATCSRVQGGSFSVA